MSYSNAQLTQKVAQLINYWAAFNTEYASWLGGSATGGTNSDGRYPLTDWQGNTELVSSPAKLEADVNALTAQASGAVDQAESSATAASSSATTATTQATLAETARIAAETAQTQAQLAKDGALDARVVSIAQAQVATTKASEASADAATSSTARDEAVTARDEAEAFATAAATFDPAQYASVSHTHDASEITSGLLSVARLPSAVALTDADVTFSQNLTILGDLQVLGTNTILNTTQLDVEDNLITVNKNVTGSPVLDAGIEVERGTSLNVRLFWNETADAWYATDASGVDRKVYTSADFTPNTNNWNEAYSWGDHASAGYANASHTHSWGEITGKPSTYTPSSHTHSAADITSGTLSNDRLPSTISQSILQANSYIRGAGNFLVLSAGESYSYATGQTAEYVYLNAEGGVEINSSPDNWGSGWAGRHTAHLVKTDGTSTFPASVTAPSFIGSLSGNASSASKLATARSISLTGDATGSVSFDGSGNVSMTVDVNTATWADQVDVNSGNTSGSWYDVVWHSGDTVYSSTGVEVNGSVNGLNASRYYWDRNTYAFRNADGSVRFQTSNGYVDIAPKNSSYAHIYTDRNSFYLNKPLYVDNGGLALHSNNYTSYVPTKTGGGASGTWGISISGNAASATWADTVDVNGGNTSSSWYDVVWHSGDTLYSSTGVEIQGSTQTLRASRLQISQNAGYFFGDANYTRFTGSSFYIDAGVPNCYLYATNTYLGATSGDTIRLRGNTLNGDGGFNLLNGAMTVKSLTIDDTTPRISFHGDNHTSGYIESRNGGSYGSTIVMSSGGNIIIGSGESTAANAVASGNTGENVHIGSDRTIYFYSNAQSWGSRKTSLINTSGDFYASRQVRAFGSKICLSHANSSYASGSITFSTSSPSGGSNGDIWYQY